MEHLPTWIEAISALVLLVVCSLGIWHRSYIDTLTQRLGLCVTAASSAFLLIGVCTKSQTSPVLTGTLAGCAIFAFGCFLKYRKEWARVLYRYERRYKK